MNVVAIRMIAFHFDGVENVISFTVAIRMIAFHFDGVENVISFTWTMIHDKKRSVNTKLHFLIIVFRISGFCQKNCIV